MSLFTKKLQIPSADKALSGRKEAMAVENQHFVHGRPLLPPFPKGCEQVLLGLGCFWGAERLFWKQSGVYTTAVGYAGGITPNPTYDEVCSGMTGHTEVVLVVFDPDKISLEKLLQVFWEAHDPTQGMRQGNDIGTQYRSAIYCSNAAQEQIARASLERYEQALTAAGKGSITTELRSDVPFYYAETYHQQYLGKNPMGYCRLRGTGVSCPA